MNNITNDSLAYAREDKPNKDLMAELVVKAKGAKRSMRQFALECGVNPSTLSRIVSKSNSGSSTDELIGKIASNADPDSGVTYDMLMVANGKKRKRSSIDSICKEIIIQELISREYDVWYSSSFFPGEMKDVREYVFDLRITLLIQEKKGHWCFEICCEPNMNTPSLTPMELYTKLLVIWGLLCCGETGADKISVIVADVNLYDGLKNLVKYIEFPDTTQFSSSIILIDLNGKSVVNEFDIKTESKKCEFLTFNKPKTINAADVELSKYNIDAISDFGIFRDVAEFDEN